MDCTQPLWPAITILIIWFLSLTLSIRDHGKPKKGENSASITLTAMLIMAILLYKGGFFDTLIRHL